MRNFAIKAKGKSKKGRLRILLALGWYSTAIHEGVARYARNAGWSLDLAHCRSLHYPSRWHGDGIIAILGSIPELDAMVRAARLPTVHLGPPWLAAGAPVISPDNEAIGLLGAKHFIDRGFKHFAYYNPGDPTPGRTPRMDAFTREIKKHGLDLHLLCPSEKQFHPRLHGYSISKWLCPRLRALPKPIALMADFDDHAIDVINACAEEGLAVPEEIAILGVDNDRLRCEFSVIPLSSIDDDQEGQGYAAAERLDYLMSGKPIGPAVLLIPPHGIVTRQSSDILKINHPQVAAVLRIIHAKFAEPITVESVVAQVPMSYRVLHDVFAREMGRTIAQEILRVRMDHACRMLVTTDNKQETIATDSGFGETERMRKAFQRILKTTPGEYRQMNTVKTS